jgi:hypothetical protein
MPTTLKFLLYLTTAFVFLLACMFFVENPRGWINVQLRPSHLFFGGSGSPHS